MNELSLMPERLENYRIINHLSKSDMAVKLGISSEKYSKIIHRKYDGSFVEYEQFANTLFNTAENKYEFFTGQHLPSDTSHTQTPAPTPNCTTEIKMLSNTIKDLSKIISHLITEMSDLKSELRSLKGVNESQGLVTHAGSKVKVPDH